MLSFVIVTTDGFQLKTRYIPKQITFSNLNGGSHTYPIASPQDNFTISEKRTINYVTQKFHRIPLSRPGQAPTELPRIIAEFCQDAIVVVKSINEYRFLENYINPMQIVILQERSSFSIPSYIENLCDNTEGDHVPRYCTLCKGQYILENTNYSHILG